MTRADTIKHILVVDDDPILREVLRAFFESRGVLQVSMAEDGNEARTIFDASAGAIDLISCDLNMPDADGIEFMQHLKEAGSQIPVLIISSAHESVVSSAALLAETHNLNLISTIRKPVNTKKLESALASFLLPEV